MWENETVVLVISLKKRILGAEQKARFSRIASDNAIPPFIKALFQQKVEEYLLSESPFSVQATPHFELRPEDLDGMKYRFQEVLRDTAIFPAKEVEDVLREALVLRLDYLIKPADTMRRMLFEKRNRVELTQMERVLDPYTKLLPYAERLLNECRRLGYATIETDEYGKIIVDMFHQMMNGESVKVILHDFSVLTDFLSETKGEEVVRVDGDLLQEFLADRNLWNFRRALDIELKLGKEDFNAVDLELTMKRYLELRAEFGQETVKTSKTEPEKEILPIEEIKIKADAKQELEPETWNLEEVIGDETLAIEEETVFPVIDEETLSSSMPIENNEIEIISEIEKISPKTEKIEEPHKEKKLPPNQMRIIRRDQKASSDETDAGQITQTEKEQNAGSSLLGLNNLIDERTEKVLVKKLFDGDRESYQTLLAKLEEAESWRVAKILIDNELFKRDVDPFSREAIKLVDLVYSRYYPEEGVGGT